MKLKTLLLALLCVSILAGNVLAEEKTKSKKKPKSDDQVLALIDDITLDVVSADERLGKFEERLTALDGRVKTVEVRQEESLTALRGIRATQDKQLEEAAVLRKELADANTEAHALQKQTQQLAGEAAQARAQAAHALQLAHAANNAAAPKGPIGKLLNLIPRLRHQP